MQVCAQLAAAMGPAVARGSVSASLLPKILTNITDNKPIVRVTTLDTLDAFVKEVGLAPIIELSREGLVKVSNPGY
jgi:hypothetical protein